jgi:hypothetical protein
MRLAVMFIVALLLIDAALLGNIGSIIGAIIDPANMVDTSSNSSNSTGGSGSTPSGASGGF